MTTLSCLTLQVNRKNAEQMRRYLISNNLLRKDVSISHDDTYVFFPLTSKNSLLKSYTIVKRKFQKKNQVTTSCIHRLNLPKEMQTNLPRSYDIIGDILLLKLSQDLLPYKEEIGEAFLQSQPHITSVYLISAVKGELRTRKVVHLAGDQKTETVHKEYGLHFWVDIKETYFSPRLATERQQVAQQVQPHEVVVDLFTGVAPFSIMIAKYAQPKIVYAIDKNKKAIDYAKKNIVQNKVLDCIEPILADATMIEEILPIKADRIIMNLPFSSFSFFPKALLIANNSCIIHYYDILTEDAVKTRIKELRTIAHQHHFRISTIRKRKIKSYSPREFYMGMDITVTKADVA